MSHDMTSYINSSRIQYIHTTSEPVDNTKLQSSIVNSKYRKVAGFDNN